MGVTEGEMLKSVELAEVSVAASDAANDEDGVIFEFDAIKDRELATIFRPLVSFLLLLLFIFLGEQ